jgi:WW domain-containing oxidoreductase
MPDTVSPAIPFGAKSTAEDVLAGLDLTGRTILVTGCNSGIGYETLRALAARGAHVIGLARSAEKAREACARAGGATTPIACDLQDLASVDAAVAAVRGLGRPLDVIVANAGLLGSTWVERVYGIEKQFWVNHVAHFRLVTGLTDLVTDGTGRIVIVSSTASIGLAPKPGILFDDLDGARGYKRLAFYGQSKLANALFAKELSRRLAPRGITVNALHPGVILGTGIARGVEWYLRGVLWVMRHFNKTEAQGAATQALLAASPLVAGLTGRYWDNCQIAQPSVHFEDPAMAARLWQVTEEILATVTKETPRQ